MNNYRQTIIINKISIAPSSQVAAQLRNGATNVLKQLHGVKQMSFKFISKISQHINNTMCRHMHRIKLLIFRIENKSIKIACRDSTQHVTSQAWMLLWAKFFLTNLHILTCRLTAFSLFIAVWSIARKEYAWSQYEC